MKAYVNRSMTCYLYVESLQEEEDLIDFNKTLTLRLYIEGREVMEHPNIPADTNLIFVHVRNVINFYPPIGTGPLAPRPAFPDFEQQFITQWGQAINSIQNWIDENVPK
jgi:hypothetical protein